MSLLKSSSELKVSLGLDLLDEWKELVICSLKDGETSLVTLEILKLDENGLKVLSREEFYHFQLVEYSTVIGKFYYSDLFGDMTFMKNRIKRGKGPDRVSLSDEVACRFLLY